ncbi:hypothetical protein cypCar_00000789 [Cyprinus carpio]|nr:hypothetical protein cypCar_00000789 [Cyprinus carpio]
MFPYTRHFPSGKVGSKCWAQLFVLQLFPVAQPLEENCPIEEELSEKPAVSQQPSSDYYRQITNTHKDMDSLKWTDFPFHFNPTSILRQKIPLKPVTPFQLFHPLLALPPLPPCLHLLPHMGKLSRMSTWPLRVRKP